MVPAPDRPVTLRDAETARHIARTAAKGAPGDRQPTLEQLLAAFEEAVPTPQARARVAAALTLAGVRTVPDLEQAEPGSRVSLTFSGPTGPSPSKGTAARRALTGFAVLAAFIGAMVLASGIGGDGERADVLPAGTTQSTAQPTTPLVATTPTVPGTTTTGQRIEDEAGTTESKALTQAAKRADAAQAERRAAARKRKIGRRVARRRAAARRAAAARRGVTVRLTPAAATYLCVDDGAGRRLFAGTLTSRRTFRAREIRLNVGLASTRVTINGKPYRLSGSPSGVSITRKRVMPLALGARPCS